MQLTLISKKLETKDAMSFIFHPEKPMTWRAGQYLHYFLEHPHPDSRGTERYFSIASAPHEKNVMVTTRLADQGSSFKSALQRFEPGAKIRADGPEGDFVVEDAAKDFVFIAGGIGITPFRSVLLDLDHRRQPIKVQLLYANRTDDFPYKIELENLAAKQSGLRIDYIVSPRRLDEETIPKSVPDLVGPLFYVSGPEPMVEALEKLLQKIGVPKGHIKTDYFPGYDWP
jgi:ferredoxin-NADP reductase